MDRTIAPNIIIMYACISVSIDLHSESKYGVTGFFLELLKENNSDILIFITDAAYTTESL